ncbi:uncharacterized protein HHUB_2680 [Halobacterium hubeiense]|uniref:Uncharacterized protein n=1 Tax=Halobacterium hubeiense TaxID=1407499 RepID=A0A0U5H5X8_9EURY|nr:hypothetical protein [Halobacterium hubeiense]CQH58131.1 uncharacterized protein HHUB_2680 [Halobacterium hubeiense]
MDEALEVVELAADAGFEGALVWVFRLLGLVVALAGLGLWLLADFSLLWLPAALLVVGLLLAVVPDLLLSLVELAG